MILLWGLLEDGTMNAVYDHLQRKGSDLLFLNHAEIDRSEISFESTPVLKYTLAYAGKQYDLKDFTSAYLRPYNFRDFLQFSNGKHAEAMIKRADIFHHVIHSWTEHTSAKVLNRPSAEATNHSKLFQSMHIVRAGFHVPESLVSNDAEEILEFHRMQGRLIYKSMSSVRSIVKEFSPGMLSGKKNLGLVLFQQKIEGENVRVHVVDKKVFACRIASDGVDYRYAESRITTCLIPDEIAERCIRLTENLGLVLAGIDLMLTPAGQWYCLEANPSPGFSYFDIEDDRPIAKAVADILSSS